MALNTSGLTPKIKRAEYSWNVDYAAAVHEGAVFTDGTTSPARPWTRVALRDFDFAGTMQKFLYEYGDFDKAFKQTCLLLEQEFIAKISSPIWDWPTGESPRDIVDKGTLRAATALEFI